MIKFVKHKFMCIFTKQLCKLLLVDIFSLVYFTVTDFPQETYN